MFAKIKKWFKRVKPLTEAEKRERKTQRNLERYYEREFLEYLETGPRAELETEDPHDLDNYLTRMSNHARQYRQMAENRKEALKKFPGVSKEFREKALREIAYLGGNMDNIYETLAEAC